MIYHLGEAAKEVSKEGKKIVVSSEDVEALYPNLEIMASARLCGEAVKQSKMRFEGVDYFWAGKYIAMTCAPKEIEESNLGETVPKRKYRKGTRPGINTKETVGKKKEGESEELVTKWEFSRTDFTEMEKRNLLAKVVEIAVRTTFRNHLYQFEGKMRVQAEGGPIGLRLTGVVARIVMDYWARKFKELVKANNLTIYMFRKYVDDINLVMEALGIGYRWNGEQMEWKKEWENEDLEKGEEVDKRTMREVRKMSDSILPFIKFKEEVASECPDGKIPMLDFQVWSEEVADESRTEGKRTEVLWEFYEKPVGSKLVIMEGSALPHRIKIQTLSQEIIRRMRNTSGKISKARRAEILTKFMMKMKRSGYSAKVRRNVALAGLKGYWTMVRTEEQGGRRVNRPKWEGASSRRFKKLAGKRNWFRKKGSKNGATIGRGGRGTGSNVGKKDDKQIETVMFVPHTPNGELARLLQEADDRFTKGKAIGRVKMVERGGSTIKNILCKNPWASEECGRGEDCFPCRSSDGRGGRCQQEGVVYRIKCQECASRGVCSEYLGESSRTGFLRGGEHLDGLKSRCPKSPLWKHCLEQHDGQEVAFKMEIVRKHKSPLTRQIHESVAIENSSAKILMNSKSEYNGSKIPRIVVEVGDQVDTEDWGGKGGRRQESIKKEGHWRINNVKKRKRKTGEEEENSCIKSKVGSNECDQAQSNSMAKGDDGEGGGRKRRKMYDYKGMQEVGKCNPGQCGPTRPEKEQSVAKVSGTRCGENWKNECGPTQPAAEQSLEKLGEEMWTECGPTQSEKEQSVATTIGTESGYEREQAQLGNIKDNQNLCQVLESVEICFDIALSLVGQICHTQQKSEMCHTQEGRKRKLCEEPSTQPSMQPRRRRKKEEILSRVAGVVKSKESIYPQKARHEENGSIWESKFNFKFSKHEVNTSRGTTKVSKSKIKYRKSQVQAQKTKITNFFVPIRAKDTGLKTGAGVGKMETGPCSSTQSQINFGGGEAATIWGGGGGEQASKGLGAINTERISDFHHQKQAQNMH